MLARASLGNDAFLFHPQGEERLADGVVDLVRASVGEVFALEVDFCPSPRSCQLSQTLREIKRCRPADKLAKVISQLFLKLRVFFSPFVFIGKLIDSDHQGLRDINTPVRAKTAMRIGD